MVDGGVALHGMLGAPGDWQGLLPESVSWQTPNLWDWWRGAGAAVDDAGLASGAAFDLWARQFNADCDQAAVPGGCLMGYSLGGRLALHAWLQQPDRWRQVWIVSAHPGLENENDRCDRFRTDSAWADRLLAQPPHEFLNDWDGQPVFGDFSRTTTNDGDRVAHITEWRREMALAFRGWSLGCQRPLWDEIARTLREHETELHWVTGSEDAKFTELARQLQGRAPRLIRREIDGAGHRVPWDCPEQWQRCLEQGLH